MRESHVKIVTNATSYFMHQYTKHYLHVNKPTDTLPPPPEDKEYLLYIHIPFCTMFCPYCSFNKFTYTKEAAAHYFKHLRKELLHVKDLGYRFNYLVLGGGTPLIDEDELIKTIELVRTLFNIQHVSCETDPNHIKPKTVLRLDGLVDRLSVGVQTFDNALLQKLGRYEKFGSGEEVYDKISAMLGILPITSVDLIFNFPNQSNETLLKDLELLQKLSPEQSSFYPLMTSSMVKNSVKKTLGTFSLANEYTFFNLIKESLKESYPSRHGWSFSKESESMIDEYVIDNEEYVGVGSGSFSFLNNTLYHNEFALDKYAECIAQRKSAVVKERTFGLTSRMYYRLMVDLFNGKLSKKKFEAMFGVSVNDALKKELMALKFAKAIKENKENILTTEYGDYLFLVLMKEFYMGMDRIRNEARKHLSL
ncbi:coproporphyrinogen III oxidase family protein [Sulfurospirillum barnesii]|uniref:Fe-S oxidoreductase, coproporphyrinogen III oxidase n=1 Tax=Sulfurospirillum barnesii (strain ATCC 700032 / DSM 10660 / SES-3) TaxID=760154 RepID=I3XUJ3_SULBS|nr:coproporphyrinogen III oxidase family protein [Sulfurospirillum barnesii]AFL67617.1 Fe-S oxidoreductase, coproporphyrinogen III oxidase [Sulfurospirillum barnesii SES-3]